MPLRRRVAFVSAAAVAVAIVLAALVCYLVVRGQLRGQVDTALRAQAAAVQRGNLRALDRGVPGIPARAGGPAQYVQIVGANGASFSRRGDIALPIDARTRAVAAGGSAGYLADIHVGDSHLREIAFPISVFADGESVLSAVQLARPLDGVDRVLSNLQLVLALLVLGGVALAAALGRLAARRVLAPLADVAMTAEHIGETEDLGSRIQVRADDEVGQLATRFNTMLERLQASRAALNHSMLAQLHLAAGDARDIQQLIDQPIQSSDLAIGTLKQVLHAIK